MGVYDHCIKKSIVGHNSWKNDKKIQTEMNKIIEFVNTNSLLPFQLLENNYKDMIGNPNYQYIDNYMSDDFYTDTFSLVFSGYPTDEDKSALTDIVIKSSKYNILDIRVGDSVEEASAKIKKYGFCISEDKVLNFEDYEDDDSHIVFRNLDVTITLEVYESIITELKLSIVTYYLDNYTY